MSIRICYRPLFTAALIVAFGGLFAAGAATNTTEKNVNKTVMDGSYSVTLKVLPAEHFTGPQQEMVREGGAAPVAVNGPDHPNHHLVVFVKDDGKPVENATVSIEYRKMEPMQSKWMSVPVTRMDAKGKGVASTHYGNNLKLATGSYEAKVDVNGNTVTIPFQL
jgi:hypothetical protein